MTFHKRLHTHRKLSIVQVDRKGKSRFTGLLRSPLTDSNRRPLLTIDFRDAPDSALSLQIAWFLRL